MMKKEFEDRIGLTITAEEYAAIEAAYMGLPESVDKSKFAKIWFSNGGMQDLFDKRLATIFHLKEDLDESERYLNRSYGEAETYQKQIRDLTAQVKALEGKISAISGLIATGSP
jgi:hypothetical protein